MSLEFVSRLDIGKENWDTFVEQSDEAWLWHCFALQEALECWPNYSDISFGLLDLNAGGKLVAVVPSQLLGGHSIECLGGPAFSNNLPRKLKTRVLDFIREHLTAMAERHSVPEINISLASMAPAFSGERCPRVNPLLELGCENTLTQTWVVDLRPGKDVVWSRMEGRARTAIRKAMKNDVHVRPANRGGDLDIYYVMHCETYKRTGVPPHPKDYFKAIWENFLAKGLAYIVFAECDGETVAAENFGIFKNRAIYWTGAASRKGLDVGANSLLQWTAMQWMIDNGYHYYETGEAFPNAQDGKLKGLSDFKKSFGGELYPLYKGKIRLLKEDLDNKLAAKNFRLSLISWLRATKELVVSVFGSRVTAIIERIVRYVYAPFNPSKK
jgi:hypothetical protein